MHTYYFYTIEDLDGITICKAFEEIVDYKMPDLHHLIFIIL